MRGIILAGGAGSRLHPMTQVMCKQLLPVYDKPMIYYPLSLLMLADIREVLLISTPKDIPAFESLLGTGEKFGIKISYKVQERPSGLPEAFILGADFIQGDDVAMILGDNIFYGAMDYMKAAVHAHKTRTTKTGAQVFGYQVEDPRRYGVVEIERGTNRVVSLEEKPENPKSHYAIPGLYIFDGSVADRASRLGASSRGETEIVDLMRTYLYEGTLNAHIIGRGISWFDAGTPESLLEAANFIAAIEKRQGLKVGCVLEVAARRGFISMKQFASEIEMLPKSTFKDYMAQVFLNLREEAQQPQGQLKV